MQPSYLDYNATAPLRPAVAAAMVEMFERTGNASSVHHFGRAARRAVDDARGRVAALVGAAAGQVIFTGSGTEANNLALAGSGRRRRLVSAIEHDSVLAAAGRAAASPVETIPVDHAGVIDLAALSALLARSDEPALVAVMLANNETGVIQPVGDVAAAAHAHGAIVHCDAVQAAGRLAINMTDLGVDLLSLSAHKLGGPQGVGALIAADHVELEPLVHGGGQERRRRAGTENVAGIVGFGVAAGVAGTDEMAAAVGLRDALETRLLAMAPAATIYGRGAPRLANTSCIGNPDVSAETQVMALDLAGVAVSAGAACSSGKMAASHVLMAMGVSERQAANAIRVSLGWGSTMDDIERFLAVWLDLHARLGRGAQATAA